MSEKLVLIDGHSILNRAFFGLPDLTNSQGLHTNAVYGFLNILFKILEEEKPNYLAVAFDVKALREKLTDESDGLYFAGKEHIELYAYLKYHKAYK